MKKQLENSYYTYKKVRKCKNCGDPIADQEHGLRKYCQESRWPDGKRKSCHDKFNGEFRKEKFAPVKGQPAFQLQTTERIGELFKQKGEDIGIDDIENFRIDLSRPMQIEPRVNNTTAYFFVKYVIIQTGLNYKIYTHDRKFN